jgi:hypothetical protein
MRRGTPAQMYTASMEIMGASNWIAADSVSKESSYEEI